MKKMFMLFALITTLSFSFFGAANPWDALNYAENFKTQLESIKQVKNQMEQIRNQVKSVQNEYESLQNQAKNLKQLDVSLSDRNIRILENALDDLDDLNRNAKSFIYDNEKMVDQFWSIYKENPEDFTKITGFDEKGLAGIKKDVSNAKKASRYAVYDAMTNAGMTATIGNDKGNLEKLLQASKSSNGALQAIQATNNLVGNSNSILLQIRSLLETNIKMSGAIAMAGDTTESAEEIEKKAFKEKRKNDAEAGKKRLDTQTNLWKKKTNWGFGNGGN
ncbi:hypothetical protein [Psychrilyobacter sp.]|uniref:hypothetical protein n=1 Tax=Psychrilyobacter sp. TaxID=2586924 RepID=UPI003018EF9A